MHSALHDVQIVSDILFNVKSSVSSDKNKIDLPLELQTRFFWEDRQRVLAATNIRPITTAVERALLKMIDHDSARQLLSKSWLRECRQRVGRDSAYFALRSAQACGMDIDTLILEECSQLKRAGLYHEALALVEPAELDVSIIETRLSERGTLFHVEDTC